MRLLIQGQHISSVDLHTLLQITHAVSEWQKMRDGVYFLENQLFNGDVIHFCQSRKIDAAYIKEGDEIDRFKLAVMDMDSTLITIECIDEIADQLGIKKQVAEITEKAMRGELDFSSSLRARVALLKGLSLKDLLKVRDTRLRLSPGAEEWIAFCKQQGVKTVLVSGGFTFFADYVKELLGLDYAYANTLEIINDKLTGNVLGEIVGAEKKADILCETAHHLGIDVLQTLAIGDGANDLLMMKRAGVSIAYHAKPIVREKASYAIDFVGLEGIKNLFYVGS